MYPYSYWGGAVAVTASVSLKLLYSKSIPEYLYYESKINPAVKILQSTYLALRVKSLSEEWFEKVSYLDVEDIPDIEWKEDSTTAEGLNSFFCLDEFADEVRGIISNDLKWYKTHFGECYDSVPEDAPTARYERIFSNNTLKIRTDSASNHWVYLASKTKQPTTFALDFDFITHTPCKETLQVGFQSSSLAERFRFNLVDNKEIKFEVVDDGFFTFNSLWDKYRIPYSIEEGRKLNVRLECIESNFILYIDNDTVMAIHVNGYIPKESNWYLIFWTGVNPQPNQNIDIEISNFKVLSPINSTECE